MSAPFVERAVAYASAGWSPIPLPARAKKWPPDGFTGYDGRYPDDHQIAAWIAERGAGNVALRLPPDVVGVDVDVYLGGDVGLAELEEKYGVLPPTVLSTSRIDGSGIRLFRRPVGWLLATDPAKGIDMVQAHHRYVVAAPSLHPEGREYHWIDGETGEVLDVPPYPGDLPELPWPWLEGLKVDKGRKGGGAATPVEVAEFLDARTDSLFPAGLKGLQTKLGNATVEGKGRHDTLVKVACWAMREAAAGLYPARDAVDLLAGWWRDVMDGEPRRRDGGEFGAAIAWAVAEAEADPARVATIRQEHDLVGWAEAAARAAEQHDDPHDEAPDEDRPPPVIVGRWLADLCAEVDAMPPPRFLVRGLIVHGDYGVLGAEKKAGKTWLMADLAVNVAAGGAWLGRYPVDTRGPVLLFAGEGGKRKLVRRLRAVAGCYGYGDDLMVKVFEQAPKLNNLDHLALLADELATTGAVLVIVDPAYLSLTGANTASLVEMGALLERVQHLAQQAGATLVLSHHWNKTGTSRGADRFTGVGFAEWGRFLISAEKISAHTDPTSASTVVVRLEVTGDETADDEVRYRRIVSADDPDDLGSAMRYRVEVLDDDQETVVEVVPAEEIGLAPAARRVLAALRKRGTWVGWRELGDDLADGGHPLKKRTILDALKKLVERDLAESREGEASGEPFAWRPCTGSGANHAA